jgi:hypothetical protein
LFSEQPLPWIEAEFEMGQRTAYRFMDVADRFAGKLATVANLAPKALYELASSTAEIQAEVERRLAAGEFVTAADPVCDLAHILRRAPMAR